MKLKTILGRFPLIIIIIIITALSISCTRNSKIEKNNKKKAVELIQNYKIYSGNKESDDFKLIDLMRISFNLSEKSGRIMEIHGWSAEKISDEVKQYKVSFSYRDITSEKEIQWLIDIETGNINPLDEYAAQLMTRIK